MRRLLAVARKEVIHLTRDVRSLIAALGLPVVLVFLYGYAVDFDLKDLGFAVVDYDQTGASRRLIQGCAAIESFTLVAELPAEEGVGGLFERREALVVLVIPRGFADDLQSHRSAPLQVLVDGTDANTASTALAYAQGAVNHVGQVLIRDELLASGVPLSMVEPAVEVRTRVFYNPNLESKQLLVPGLVAVILMLMAALLTSGVVVREKERGTFELLAASPVSPAELIVGKLLPYLVLALFDVVLTVGVGWLAFGVVPQGSLFLLLLLSLLFVASALGLGLFFSCVAKTQQLAMLLAFVATLLPTMLLSGFAFPIRNMPRILQNIAQITPATHYMQIVRGVILKGAGIDVLLRPTIALAILSVLVLTLAVSKFKKRL